MFVFKVVMCLLPVVGVFGNSSHIALSQLIQRIRAESDSVTVYFIGLDGVFLGNFLKTQSETPTGVFTSPPGEANDRFYSHPTVLVVQAQEKSFDLLQQHILHLAIRKFVIIHAETLENLQKYFSYFSDNKFTRIFGIVGNKSYAHTPYMEQTIQLLYSTDLLPNSLDDLNGFTFRTTVEMDIPRTFWYPDVKGRPQIGGCFGQILVHFLRRHNARFKEIFTKPSPGLFIPGIINATINNELDISMNVYVPTSGLDLSYPVKIVTWPILVPVNGYVNPDQYFLRPFCPITWFCIGLTLAYISLMDFVKDICINSNADVWHTFSRTFLMMLNLPSPRQITGAYRFHTQVLLFAFVLGNLYAIYFTSYLTVFIKVKQYETIQDLIDNHVPVMIPRHEWDLISDAGLHPFGFEEIVSLVDYETYIREMNSMRNTSSGYGVGLDRGEFLVGLQTFFQKPLFRMTTDSLGDYYVGFFLAHHSRFKEILNDFIIQVMDTGLMDKWDQDAIAQARRAGFKLGRGYGSGGRKSTSALTIDNLRFAWICLAHGLALAGLVFLGEIFGSTLRNLCACRRTQRDFIL